MRALEDAAGNGGGSGALTSKALESDVEACGRIVLHRGRWVPLEYMPWMGDLLGADCGPIHCPNAQCRAEVGRFDWNDTLFGCELSMAMELPLVGIEVGKIVAGASPKSRGSLSRLNSGSSVESYSENNTPRGDGHSTPRDRRDSWTEGTTPRGAAPHSAEWPAVSHGHSHTPKATPLGRSARRGSGTGGLGSFNFGAGGEAAPSSAMP
jgi:hypothetical protein